MFKSSYTPPAGQHCGSAGLAEPLGACGAGWYCSGGAFTSQPSDLANVTGIDPLNTTCPAYSLNNTGDICQPGMFCHVMGREREQTDCSCVLYFCSIVLMFCLE